MHAVEIVKFRKKPVEIEAIQFNGDNIKECLEFTDEIETTVGFHYFKIPTLEGVMTASVGDWIIKGVGGEFYPVKNDISRSYRNEYSHSSYTAIPIENNTTVNIINTNNGNLIHS